jgi:hypothetical protein
VSDLKRLTWKPGEPNPWKLGQAAVVSVVDREGRSLGEWYCSSTTGPGVLWIMPPAGPIELRAVQDPAFISTHAGASWCGDEPQEVRQRKIRALRDAIADETRLVPVEGFKTDDYDKVARDIAARTGRAPEPHVIQLEMQARNLYYPNALAVILDPVNNDIHRGWVDKLAEREVAQEGRISKMGKRKNFQRDGGEMSGALAEALANRLNAETARAEAAEQANVELAGKLDRVLARLEAMENANQSSTAGNGVAKTGRRSRRATNGEPAAGVAESGADREAVA